MKYKAGDTDEEYIEAYTKCCIRLFELTELICDDEAESDEKGEKNE